MASNREILINEFSIHLTINNFPNIDYWLQDFPTPGSETRNSYQQLTLSIVDNISVNSSIKYSLKDGKYSISWFDTPLRTMLWQSNDHPDAKMLGVANPNGITLSSTSENLLGRWFRHFIFVQQYIEQALIFLHAAAISKGDKTFVIVGPSGAGKTTHAYMALRCGWKVLADETLLILPNREIMPFFSTITWECRTMPNVKREIDELVVAKNRIPDSEAAKNLLDYKGRLIFYPQQIIPMTRHFPITGVIVLEVPVDDKLEENYSFNLDSINTELGKRTSMRSIFDLVGEEDYDTWQKKAMDKYKELLGLPIHSFRQSSECTSVQNFSSFISLLERLESS